MLGILVFPGLLFAFFAFTGAIRNLRRGLPLMHNFRLFQSSEDRREMHPRIWAWNERRLQAFRARGRVYKFIRRIPLMILVTVCTFGLIMVFLDSKTTDEALRRIILFPPNLPFLLLAFHLVLGWRFQLGAIRIFRALCGNGKQVFFVEEPAQMEQQQVYPQAREQQWEQAAPIYRSQRGIATQQPPVRRQRQASQVRRDWSRN